MFKHQTDILNIIKHDSKVLEALDGIGELTPHMHSYIEQFLTDTLGFRKPSYDYEKVHMIWDRNEICELVQYHIRMAPKEKKSFRTSKYSLLGEWTTILQIVVDHKFEVQQIISLPRDVIESHYSDKPWTIGKCVKLGSVIYPDSLS